MKVIPPAGLYGDHGSQVVYRIRAFDGCVQRVRVADVALNLFDVQFIKICRILVNKDSDIPAFSQQSADKIVSGMSAGAGYEGKHLGAVLKMQYFAEEQFGSFMLRVGKKVLGTGFFQDLPFVHEDYSSGGGPGKTHFVGNNYHRHPLVSKVRHHVKDFFDHLRVEGTGGFVEQHYFGVHCKGSGDGDTLLLPA